MANNRNTYQQQHNISVNREKIVEIASDEDFTKKDYKVFMLLLTQLNGYSEPEKSHYKKLPPDPKNFKILDIDTIAETLGLSRKDVKKSINFLIDFGFVETGSNETVGRGYRFTF